MPRSTCCTPEMWVLQPTAAARGVHRRPALQRPRRTQRPWRGLPAAHAPAKRARLCHTTPIPPPQTDCAPALPPPLQDKAKGGDAGGGGAAAGDAPGSTPPRHHKRPPVWQLITSNLYTHRERKEQDEDDIMICQCKKIWATDGTTVGCGAECLNRMLNIECVEVRQGA